MVYLSVSLRAFLLTVKTVCKKIKLGDNLFCYKYVTPNGVLLDSSFCWNDRFFASISPSPRRVHDGESSIFDLQSDGVISFIVHHISYIFSELKIQPNNIEYL